MQPYSKVWPTAMVLGLQPQNVASSLTKVHNISDEIWYQAGDRSVDYTWYTKRAIVSNLYVATEIYMLQDTSEDNEDTWEFLDRRLDES